MKKICVLSLLLILFGSGSLLAQINFLDRNTPDSIVLFDFTQAPASIELKAVNVVTKAVPEGLALAIEPNDTGSICIEGKWDLSEWVYLTIVIKNSGLGTVRFDPVISGHLKAKVKARPLWTIGWVQPSETRCYNSVLLPHYSTRRTTYAELSKDFPNTRGMPEGISFTNSFDLAQTNKIEIIFPASEDRRDLVLKSVQVNRPAVSSLYKDDPKGFFPFIDQYGQYKHGYWPGKILDDQQLLEDVNKEKKDIKAHKGSQEWSQYGGCKNGPKLEATGHFRTEKVNNRWWMVDPEGYLFWSAGINSACKLAAPTPIKKREHFFENIPSKDDPLYGSCWIGNEYDFGKATLLKKYGSIDEKQYAALGLQRMRSWGFNTLGGWGYEDVNQFPVEKRIPYTASVWTQRPMLGDKFPDVFDERWAKNVRNFIRNKAKTLNKDPFFIGYFVDNEMHWFEPNMMASYVLSMPADCAGKIYYIDLLKKKFTQLDAFNEAVGLSFDSWTHLLNNRKKIKVTQLWGINLTYYQEMSKRYFSTIRQVIDEESPGNLFLGCRWHVDGQHRNKHNVAIGAKYLDIISFNQYDNEITATTFPEMAGIDKPYIVSEFNFGALDRGKFYPGLNYASDQRNRGEKYQNFIKSALADTKCVGAHWFMWGNSTTAGRSVVGENANCGIVSEMDQPYYEMLEYMRMANYSLYENRVNK